MAHSTHSDNNWRQKERERVRGWCFSFCPSPPSFTSRRTLSLTYSLNILPVSDFNQVFRHHDNPGSPRLQSGSPQWDVSLFPSVCPFPACPFSCSFSRRLRGQAVVFTLSSSHLPPHPSRSFVVFVCPPVCQETVSQPSGEKSAVRLLIWSCQTYQGCPPAHLTFSDYDNRARPVKGHHANSSPPRVHACLHLASSTSSDKGLAPRGFGRQKGVVLNVIGSIQAFARATIGSKSQQAEFKWTTWSASYFKIPRVFWI